MPSHHASLYISSSFEVVVGDTLLPTEECEIEFCRTAILSIAQARLLIQSAFTKPFEKSTKLIVIETGQIAIEAQHALLKILEEPPSTTKFIFVMPTSAGLLATLLSRLYLSESASSGASALPIIFRQFLGDNYTNRLASIGVVTKNKDLKALEDLYNGLQIWLAGKTPSQSTHHLLDSALFLPQRGAAKKMLWEHIAFLLPMEQTAV